MPKKRTRKKIMGKPVKAGKKIMGKKMKMPNSKIMGRKIPL